MSSQIAAVWVPVRTAPPAAERWFTDNVIAFGHHRRKRPDDHLCVCGRLRDECVRSAVRALWRTE
jgi:hypothetical protein